MIVKQGQHLNIKWNTFEISHPQILRHLLELHNHLQGEMQKCQACYVWLELKVTKNEKIT